MALLFADGFDHYADADRGTKWTQAIAGGSGNLYNQIAAVGARGTNGLKIRINNSGNTNTGSMNVILPASGATVIVGVRFRCVTPFANGRQGTNSEIAAGALSQIFAVRRSSTTQFWLNLNLNGTISLYRGSTLLGTTATALRQNIYHFLELKVVLSTTVGTVDFKIDGVADAGLTLTGVNTANQATAVWDEFRLGHISAAIFNDTTVEYNFDDLYVCDGSGANWNNFMGDKRVDLLLPNAAGTTSQFTRSTGADQWATIDEASANGDTDYNASSTVNHVDTLNFPVCPVAGTIDAVQINIQAKKTDAGPGLMRGVVRHGGTDYPGAADLGIPGSYAFLREIRELNPGTGVAFTASDIDSAEFGYKKTA